MRWPVIVFAVLAGLLLATPALADVEVTVGSDDFTAPQNRQMEPAVAVDANRPNVLAAGAIDAIDSEACNADDPTACGFSLPPEVGRAGVYFSFDSGHTWTQPTYTGYTARHCLGPPGFSCTPKLGPIGTLPWYYENGLVTEGDPALAFGPRRGQDGTFSWANGSRLYYATLTGNFKFERGEDAIKGSVAIGVSRADNVPAAAAGDKNAWLPPVIVGERSSTTHADKDQIWADNTESSPFFGNVYLCWAEFRGSPRILSAAPLVVARSTDGGDTWSQQNQLTRASNTAPTHWGQSACAVRTDSRGTVYVFYEEFQSYFVFLPPHGTHFLVKSFDGGRSWTRPQALFQVTNPCYYVDPVSGFCAEDGVAGARNPWSGGPSVDIANGAPTGADATDLIVDAWVDGRDGLNDEHVLVSQSTTGGSSWSAPTAVESPGDRGLHAAAALAPDGSDLWITYNAFQTPFRNDTFTPRSSQGILLHSDIAATGAPTGWAEVHRGLAGDPRGSGLAGSGELLGDYDYAAATRDYGAGLWNDVRDAADCPALDARRMALRGGPPAPVPAPNVDCPPTFANSDIFAASITDPTP